MLEMLRGCARNEYIRNSCNSSRRFHEGIDWSKRWETKRHMSHNESTKWRSWIFVQFTKEVELH